MGDLFPEEIDLGVATAGGDLLKTFRQLISTEDWDLWEEMGRAEKKPRFKFLLKRVEVAT